VDAAVAGMEVAAVEVAAVEVAGAVDAVAELGAVLQRMDARLVMDVQDAGDVDVDAVDAADVVVRG
jgi:hypothetical protein